MSDALSVNDVLNLAINRTSALSSLWNIFIAVSTAIVGLMASAKPFTNSKLLKTILSAVFIIFALSNLSAILELAELRTALLNMIPPDIDKIAPVIESLSPAKDLQYIVFHFALDLLVIATIWLVPWSKLRNTNPS